MKIKKVKVLHSFVLNHLISFTHSFLLLAFLPIKLNLVKRQTNHMPFTLQAFDFKGNEAFQFHYKRRKTLTLKTLLKLLEKMGAIIF